MGLERGGFTEEQIGRVKEAYRILFRSKLGLQDALAQLRGELASHPEVEHLVRFVEQSKRGVTR